MSQKVIILGAGASKADGAPVQNDIFREYVKLYRKGNFHNDSCPNVNSFLKNFFGIDVNEVDLKSVDKLPFPTFEEVLGIIEMADIRNEYFKENLKKKQSLMNMKRCIIELIAIILEKSLSTDREKRNHYHLASRLEEAGTLQDTTFISFNYDIIIDNVLMKYLSRHYNVDYGLDPEPHFRDENAIKLYKLHGSLNWLFCPYCSSLNYGSSEKTAVKHLYNHGEMCRNWECESKDLEPLIIPPTYFKSMGNYYIQKVWKEADHALQKAHEVYLCGYSLPEADIHVKYLLKRAEMFNTNRSIKFYIINGNKETKEAKEEENRFKGFFRDPQEVHYTNLKFEEFSKKGISILRQ